MINYFNIIVSVSLLFAIRHAGTHALLPIIVIVISILLVTNLTVVGLAFKKVKSLLTGFKTIHASFFFLFIALMIWRVRPAYSFYTDPLDHAAQYKLVCMGIAGLLALVSLMSNIGKHKIPFPMIPLLIFIYAVLGLLSTLQGEGNTYYSVYKAAELLVDTVFLFAAIVQITSLKEAKKLCDLILLLFCLLLITEVIAAIVNPEAGFYLYDKGAIGRLFSGAFPLMDPNGLGFLSATLVVASASRVLNTNEPMSRQLYMLIMLFSLTTLILAQSRTSIFGMLAGLTSIFVLCKRWKEFAIVSVITIVGFVLFSDYLITYIMRGQSVEMFQNVSGRAVMWDHVWNKFLQSPLLGTGLATAGFVMKIYAPGQTAPVFNSYLECLLNSGIIGFAPWIVALMATFFLLLRGSIKANKNNPELSFNAEKIGIMVVLLARSMTTSMLTIHSVDFTLYLTLMIAAQINLLQSVKVPQASLRKTDNV